MWTTCLAISVGCLVVTAVASVAAAQSKLAEKSGINLLNVMFVAVFVSAVLMFFPLHSAAAEAAFMGDGRALLLSVFNSLQVFGMGCEFGVVEEGLRLCPEGLEGFYKAWASVLFVLGPLLTFGVVLSLFKNLSAFLKYLGAYFRDAYIFSELNEKSLVLAGDIKAKHTNAAIVFTDVFDGGEEGSYELLEGARKIGAICFKKDILAVDFQKHSGKKAISFFTIGNNETENVNQSLKLIETYKARSNTHIYVFSAKVESEILLTAIDKGQIKVRRINEVQSLVNRVLYERGEIIFESAGEAENGVRKISAVVVGLGRHGREMVKALTWFGQMNGYRLEINAFDMDPLAEEKFAALAPELMSPDYNGVDIEGESQYKITIHSGLDVESLSFAKAISGIGDATYVFVALGNDDANINTAVNLRMYFERMKIHPVIQAIVYNSQQKKALCGIKNYRGQEYDIEFIGDVESSYTEAVIIDSELEEDALKRHLKWGKEEEFWGYEYNYRSSTASAIHMRARIKCGIPGADKKEEDLTEEEKLVIQTLEHRRWNAYMRAEGYVYSGCPDKSSRNDLAKMHHDLVDFASLTDEDKAKDSSVGTT